MPNLRVDKVLVFSHS